MFLLGVFFWQPVQKLAEIRRAEEKVPETQALSLASFDIVAQQQRRISIPRRFTAPMREMLALQPRFLHMRGRRAIKLLEHRRFRAAYDFMLLRAETGQVDEEIARFWTEAQTQSTEQRTESFQLNAPPQKKRRPRGRRRRKKPQDS